MTHRVLVTGGTGFVGGALVEALCARGHALRVLALGRGPFWRPSLGVEYIDGSIGDAELLKMAVAGCDVVAHLAWSTVPASSNASPERDVSDNVVGSLRVFEACVTADVKHVLFLSSGGTVYGPPEQLPIEESHRMAPLSSYGITKLAVENYVRLFQNDHGLPYTILRVANAYGEGQNPESVQGAVGVFLRRASRREAITIWGDGEVVRDYIHVSDAVGACVRAIDVGPMNEAFNIGTGVGASLNQLVAAIGRVLGGEPPRVERQPSRRYDVHANILNCDKARRLLAWEPQVVLDAGLARTWRWMSSLGGTMPPRSPEQPRA